MTTNAAQLLAFANLQMGAEALFSFGATEPDFGKKLGSDYSFAARRRA